MNVSVNNNQYDRVHQGGNIMSELELIGFFLALVLRPPLILPFPRFKQYLTLLQIIKS